MNKDHTVKRPPISSHLFGATREEWLHALHLAHPSFEFRIGKRRLGEANFRPEHPDFEVVGEFRPVLKVRRERFAVYARRRVAVPA